MAEIQGNSAFIPPGDMPLHPSKDSRPQSVAAAAVIRLNPEQVAGIRAAGHGYELVGPAGQTICIRRQENATGAARIALTDRQWDEANLAKGTVEIQDDSGSTVGYLVLNPHVNLFYTTEAIESLVKRAREGKPGRTLGEILGEALTRAGA